jgi:hypothetical protein
VLAAKAHEYLAKLPGRGDGSGSVLLGMSVLELQRDAHAASRRMQLPNCPVADVCKPHEAILIEADAARLPQEAAR